MAASRPQAHHSIGCGSSDGCRYDSGGLQYPPAHADQQKQIIGIGLTKPAGTVLDPIGRMWVSDSVAGFCRMSEPVNGNAGTIEEDTCLGGSLPGAGPGPPKVPGVSIVLDPTPGSLGNGDETAFIPDSAVGSSHVVRAVWNPPLDLFEYSSTLTVLDGDVRPNAVSDGPDGNIYLSFANARSIIKIVDPTIMHPSIESVASVSTRALGLVAAGYDSNGYVSVYVLETTGLRAFSAPGNGEMTDYIPLASYNVGVAASIFYDYDAHVIYTGTSSGTTAGTDKVSRLNLATGAVDNQWLWASARSAAWVCAVANCWSWTTPPDSWAPLREPAGGAASASSAALWPKLLPAPTLASGAQAPNPEFTNDTTPTFGVAAEPAGSALECSMGGAWVACTGGTYTSTALNNGPQTFSVRPAPGGFRFHGPSQWTRSPRLRRSSLPPTVVKSSTANRSSVPLSSQEQHSPVLLTPLPMPLSRPVYLATLSRSQLRAPIH